MGNDRKMRQQLTFVRLKSYSEYNKFWDEKEYTPMFGGSERILLVVPEIWRNLELHCLHSAIYFAELLRPIKFIQILEENGTFDALLPLGIPNSSFNKGKSLSTKLFDKIMFGIEFFFNIPEIKTLMSIVPRQL